MFLADSHLPMVLTADHYKSAEQYQREVKDLFLPTWHLVGTFSDLPNDGDFLTEYVFGHPLIVWRSGGEFHTFLNVCPHRFSRLTSKECGHIGERLICQYHGWEYDCQGNTRKIPDAQSFKPMTKGALGLTKFRTETCGQLIFVTLNDEAPSLQEFLGVGYEIGEKHCSANRRLAGTLDYEFDANWKCKVENSIESYHVSMVHSYSFGQTPDEKLCRHEIDDRWSIYYTTQPARAGLERFLDRLIHRLAHVERDDVYKHYMIYPHIMFGKMKMFSWVEWNVPVSPTRTRVLGKFFCHQGSGRILSPIFSRMLARWQVKFFKKLMGEDVAAMLAMQRGMESDRLPSNGLVSIREERCYHFQKYIKQATTPESAAVQDKAVSAVS